MPATVVIGLQWGDEGKGKAVDLLVEADALVVRYQGGDNAGHTIVLGDETFKLHLVPSGVLHPEVTPVIAHGVVVNPRVLLDEIEMLESRGIATARLRLSAGAHLILPYHAALDAAMEARLGADGIGTTKRGIGPAYADRALRTGIRAGDLLDPPRLRHLLERVVPDKNAVLGAYGGASFTVDEIYRPAIELGQRLRPLIVDTVALVQDALAEGRQVVFEGAQGTLLDIDQGSYPFVTSSHPTTGGACVGGGISPRQVGSVVGVMKAYATRVGSGPFPTELDDATGTHLLEKGREYGTTTGRRRRCGWFDVVPLRHAIELNGVTEIMLNKLDILSGLDEVCVCTAYEIDGRRVTDWTPDADALARATPIYEAFAGWSQALGSARNLGQLPVAALRYLDALEDLAGVPITLVSIGPERTQTITRRAGKVRAQVVA
jgi:adenylosuccinate synthase